MDKSKLYEIGIGAIVTIVVAIVGIWLTHYFQTRDPFKGDVSAAIEGLSSGELKRRLKAIRSLESINKDTDKYRPEILEALATFVRDRSPWKPGAIHSAIEEDVQSALTLIGRIPKKDDRGNVLRVDMHNVDISGANLQNADLEGVVLWGSNLRNVVLARANLQEADLGGVDFTGASLEMADLRGAYLWMSAPLEPIRPCIFSRTRLAGVKLDGAHLEAAILTEAIDLSEEEVRKAIINQNTQLPRNMRMPNQPMLVPR